MSYPNSAAGTAPPRCWPPVRTGRARGCGELGSDSLLDNADSLRFHAAAGFSEVERVACFIKKL